MNIRDQIDQLSDEELSQFSDEELDKLISMAKQEQSAPAPTIEPKKEMIGGQEFTVVDGDKPTMSDRAGAAALGALNAITFNNVDELGAVAGTAKDLVNDPMNTIADMSAIYNKHKTDAQAALAQVGQDMPAEYIGGNIAGSIGMSPYLAGLNSLKGAAALGAAYGFGEADISKGNVMSETAKGAAAGFAGGVIGKTISNKLSSSNTQKLINKEAELVSQKAQAFNDTFGITGKNSDFYHLLKSKGNMPAEQFYKDVLDNVDMSGVKSPIELMDKSSEALKNIWNNKLQPIINQVDTAVPEGIIPAKNLSNIIIDSIQDAGSNLSPDRIAKKLASVIPADSENISMAQAQTILNKLDGIQGMTKSSKKIIDSSIREAMLDAVESSGGNLDEAFKSAKREYGNVAEAVKFMDPVIDNFGKAQSKYGLNMYYLSNRVGDAWKQLDLTSPGKSVTGLAKLFKGFNPRPEFEPVGRLSELSTKLDATRESIRKIGDVVAANPGKYSRLMNAVGLAAAKNTEDFLDKVGVLGSTIELDQKPMERSSASINQNMVHLLNLSKELNPGIYQSLLKAGETGDQATINGIVNSAARLPEFAGKIQPGLGIDGMVVDEMDELKAKEMIKSANISNTQKAFQLEQLEKSRLVPQFQPEISFKQEKILAKRNKDGKKEQDF